MFHAWWQDLRWYNLCCPGLRPEEWRRCRGWRRRSLEVSTSSSWSTSSPAPSTGTPCHSHSTKPSSCARWEIVAEPSRASLAAGTVDGPPRTEDWQFRMDDLKIEQRCGWCDNSHNMISREEEVSVLWTITQSCIEDYRITLCPQHHQVGIEDHLWWEFSLKGLEVACWIGNFSRPNLKNEDDFLVKIQLTNLNDFDFHFEDCQVFCYDSSKTPDWFGSESCWKSDKRWRFYNEVDPTGVRDQHPTHAW